MAQSQQSVHVNCLCGKVEVLASGKAQGSIACHCHTCRKATAAPFHVFAVFPSVEFTKGKDEVFAHTKDGGAITRYRCKTCGVWVHSKLGEYKTIPTSFSQPEIPLVFHQYYDDRFIDVADNLPKYKQSGFFNQIVWTPENDAKKAK